MATDRFYYSEEQKQKWLGLRQTEPTVPLKRFARLDGGSVVEYTECVNIERETSDPEYRDALRPHAERCPDSVYLGEGDIESVEM